MKTFIVVSVIAFLLWNVLGGVFGAIFLKQKYEEMIEEKNKEIAELKKKIKLANEQEARDIRARFPV